MSKNRELGQYIIDFDSITYNPDDYFLYSSLYKGVKSIILETNESCLISIISKMEVFENSIIILDGMRARSVYIFDTEGSFVRKIGSVGGGPGEYSRPIDFTIDRENKTIYVLDTQLARINKYSLITGNFISSINLEPNVMRFKIEYFEGNLYSFVNFFVHSDDNFLLRVINETSGKVEKQYLNVMEYSKGISYTFGNHPSEVFFSRENGNPVFTQLFMDDIIEIGKNKITPFISFKGKDLITSNDLTPIIENANSNFRVQTIQLNKYSHIESFIENGDFIIIYISKGTSLLRVLFNKQSNVASITSRSWDDFLVKEKDVRLGFIPKIGCYDSHGVYCYIFDIHIERCISSAKAGILSPDLDKLEEIKNLDEYANPILFYYEFKD